jgi:lactate dehydrogenase-like 2-hydroxyacid dehydrogenase
MLPQCDIVTIAGILSSGSKGHSVWLTPENCPLHVTTRGLFNKLLIAKMKKGAWLVNTARGAICVAEDVAEALERGHLNGYAGDVWSTSPLL